MYFILGNEVLVNTCDIEEWGKVTYDKNGMAYIVGFTIRRTNGH